MRLVGPTVNHGLPRWLSGKNLPAKAGDPEDTGSILGSGSLQQKQVYLGSAKNCNLGSANMASHMQFLLNKERRTPLRGKGS